MNKFFFKKQILMLVSTIWTVLSAQAMDSVDQDGGKVPCANVTVIIAAPAPEIDLLLDYKTLSIEQIKIQMTAGLDADASSSRFDLTNGSYSHKIAGKLLAMDRAQMIAAVAGILQGDGKLLGKSGQLFRWLNNDNEEGNITGQEIWHSMANLDAGGKLKKHSVGWFRKRIQINPYVEVNPIHMDNYILALIGRDVKILMFKLKGIACVPKHMNQLTTLQILDFFYNKIAQIAVNTFWGMISLQRLDLSNNFITQIAPDTFAGLISLQELELGCNQIEAIAANAFYGLVNLKSLDMSHNQITTIAAGAFIGCIAMKLLHLNNNQIKQIIDNAFRGLSALQTLHLNNNQITHISASAFYGLGALQIFYLHNNHLIATADDAFTVLVALQLLDLHANRLKVFPSSLLKLPQLSFLLLDQCFDDQLLQSAETFRPLAQSIQKAFSVIEPTIASPAKLLVAKTLAFYEGRKCELVTPLGQKLLVRLSAAADVSTRMRPS